MTSDGYQVSDSVVAQSVGDETVLLELASGTYFSLNDVGSIVWQGVVEGLPLERLVERVVDRYEVDAERATADVEQLLRDALDQGLLVAG